MGLQEARAKAAARKQAPMGALGKLKAKKVNGSDKPVGALGKLKAKKTQQSASGFSKIKAQKAKREREAALLAVAEAEAKLEETAIEERKTFKKLDKLERKGKKDTPEGEAAREAYDRAWKRHERANSTLHGVLNVNRKFLR